MIVGYARVGTDGQSHDAQQVAGRQGHSVYSVRSNRERIGIVLHWPAVLPPCRPVTRC